MKYSFLLFSIMLFLSAGITLTSQAQFNRSFDASSIPWDIVKCNNGDFCVVSETGFRRYDVNGNLIWERQYILAAPAPDEFLTGGRQCKLVHTDDDGIIFFALDSRFFSVNAHMSQPMAMKLDGAGNLIWSRKYGFSYHTSTFNPGNSGQVDGLRMHRSYESYLFTFPGTPDSLATSGYDRSVSLNTIAITETGFLIFNHRYYLPYTAGTYVREEPHTITYAGMDAANGAVYFISGYRVEYNAANNSPLNRGHFRMMIDQYGTIVRKYRTYAMPGYTAHGHSVYDSVQDVVLNCFTIGLTGITKGPEYSVMAVQSVDKGLNTVWGGYYWNPNSVENFVNKMGLSTNKKSEYIIHGFFIDNQRVGDDADDGVNTPSLLKIDAKGDPLFYKHYIQDEMINGSASAFLVNPIGNSENYIFSAPVTGTVLGATGTGGPASYPVARLFGTDINGDVCSSTDQPVNNAKLPEEAPVIHEYISTNRDESFTLPMQEIPPTYLAIEDCNFFVADAYKNAPPLEPGIEKLQQNTITLFPTWINSSEKQEITLNMGTNVGRYELQIFSMEGRVVLTNSGIVNHKGANVIIPVGTLIPGNYFVQVKNAAGSQNTIQITKF